MHNDNTNERERFYDVPVGLDIETGGFKPKRHALLQIGLYSKERGRFSVLVRRQGQEGDVVEATAARVNGWISDEDWDARGALPLKEALELVVDEMEMLRNLTGARRVLPVAHMASNDCAFVLRALSQTFMHPRWNAIASRTWRCSCQLMRDLMDAERIPDGSASLDRLMELSGQAPRAAVHESGGDAEAAWRGREWLMDLLREEKAPNTAERGAQIVDNG